MPQSCGLVAPTVRAGLLRCIHAHARQVALPTFVPTLNWREVVAMSERFAIPGARPVDQVARCVSGCAALVLMSSAPPDAQAQANPPVQQRYLSDGANMTTVPRPGEPGSAWFSSGADATTIPRVGQPGSEYFSRGADATSTRSSSLAETYFSHGAEVTTPQPGTPAGEYLSRGADATSAKQGTVAGQYFSQGAELTSVPKPGQFGAEYFSQGADVTSMSRRLELPTAQPPAPASTEEQASPAQAPSEPESAPEQAVPSEQPDAGDQAAADEGAAESTEAPGEEPAAALTTAQEPPPPGAGRTLDPPASTTSDDATPVDSTRQRARADADVGTAGSRAVLDVLASYTLALMLALVAPPLLVLLVAFGLRAYVRRHA